jgi:hypothetical protein
MRSKNEVRCGVFDAAQNRLEGANQNNGQRIPAYYGPRTLPAAPQAQKTNRFLPRLIVHPRIPNQPDLLWGPHVFVSQAISPGDRAFQVPH